MKDKKSIPSNNRAGKTPEGTAPQCSGSKKGVEFGMIPLQDLAWVMDQSPAVIRLFHECWLCDPYGSRWMQLNTILKDRAFREAKKRLSNQGLFVFKRETSIQDSRSTVCWMVKNLHGSRVKGYWEDYKSAKLDGTTMPECGTIMPESGITMPECGTDMPISGTAMPPISPQTLTQSASQSRSTSFQYLFNIFSISLSEAERENFLDFGRKKARELPNPPALPDKWVAANFQDLYRQFQATAAGRKAEREAIATKYDWRNDPRFDDWIWKAWNGGYPWTQEDAAEREECYAFWKWAQDTNAYQGVCYQ